MWEMFKNFVTDARVIVSLASVGIIGTVIAFRNWIKSGAGIVIILSWVFNKAVDMFTSDDAESKENAEVANIIFDGIMKLPNVKKKTDEFDRKMIAFTHDIESRILQLRKDVLDLDNRIALKIDDDVQITEMINLKHEYLKQIEVLKRDKITA